VALAAVLLSLPRRAALTAAALGLALAVFSYVRAPMPERVDFDRVAGALVEAGWAPGDAILVIGSLPDFRSPLEWYLPGDVTLPEAAPREACTAVWVVTDVAEGRELLDQASPERRDDVGTVEVARVPWADSLAAEAESAGGRYLDSAAGAGCLRPLEDRTT
jgi:hypothetical protein